MSIKINLGITKKIGQPNYSSLGSSCHVEFELDGNFNNGGTERFQQAARNAYAACRQAVDTELALDGASVSERPTANAAANDRSNGTQPRPATASQVRAIHAIANRNRADLPTILSQQARSVSTDALTNEPSSGCAPPIRLPNPRTRSIPTSCPPAECWNTGTPAR